MLAEIKKQGECEMTREEIVKLGNESIAKAQKDPEFKKLLLSDGNKAVKEATGKDLPIKFTVHESDEKHLVFILPKFSTGELNENDLSGVSGGVSGGLDLGTMPTMVVSYGGYFPRNNKNFPKLDLS